MEEEEAEVEVPQSAASSCCSVSCCRTVMHNAVVDALATSSAHGINRIITSKSASLKAMWTMAFLVFLGLFCSQAVTLLCRLTNVTIVRTYEMDKVPFVFPDLYFCPSNPYSGSMAYSLNKSEAEVINDEVHALELAYSEILGMRQNFSPFNKSMIKAMYIQYSLPVDLMTRYLAQQAAQSITLAQVDFSHRLSGPVNVTTFSHPENLVCFRLDIDPKTEAMSHLESTNLKLVLELSTDPYFADFAYSGHPVSSIADPITDEEYPFQLWSHSHGTRRMKNNGFKMLIVPRGAYPSLVYETQFRLSPGHSYEVKIRMEENVYSSELRGSHCINNPPIVAFMDHMTGERVKYKYSLAACYYQQISASLKRIANCTYSDHPAPWDSPSDPPPSRCANMSEVEPKVMRSQHLVFAWRHRFKAETQARQVCRNLQPCVFPRYAASSYSFDRWPVFKPRLAQEYFQAQMQLRPAGARVPAMAQVTRLAELIADAAENRSARLERMLNAYIAESMIRVEILADSPFSPQVLIAYSYSVTSFLADVGGLLGLYIGCSLLTVCELLELLYHLVYSAARQSGKNRAKNPGHQQLDGAPKDDAKSNELANENETSKLHCQDQHEIINSSSV